MNKNKTRIRRGEGKWDNFYLMSYCHTQKSKCQTVCLHLFVWKTTLPIQCLARNKELFGELAITLDTVIHFYNHVNKNRKDKINGDQPASVRTRKIKD